MSRVLVFDTETTGLLPRGANPENTEQWQQCRLVQLAWEFYHGSTLVSQGCYTILPDGFTIPESASRIHGITQAMAVLVGVPVTTVLEEFQSVVNQTDVLVAHNITFDWNLMGAEYYRQLKYIPEKWKSVGQYCTMKAGTKPGAKWPKLGALYTELFDKTAVDCHQADKDVRYCAEIYFQQTAAK
jgi:DNA polymerase-3 subunit alpha